MKINKDTFEQNTETHNHNTHLRLDLHIHFCKTNVFKKGIVKFFFFWHDPPQWARASIHAPGGI